jgi:uncharacterized protein (DUF58 family)
MQPIRLLRALYLTDRILYAMGGLMMLFVAAFALRQWAGSAGLGQIFFSLGISGAAALAALSVTDIALLFGKMVRVRGVRETPKVLSLSDENTVRLHLTNTGSLPISLEVIDELPDQFQKRDFNLRLSLKPDEEQVHAYTLRPVRRGEYRFHAINIFARTQLGLWERRFREEAHRTVPVYPSVLQMKQFELQAFTRISTMEGIKRMRRIGNGFEFEQIRTYVQGDDYRSINWKATSRRNDLMVNQYEDERSQQVYVVIDKSRSMKMPFRGMSLLDHAINAGLALSNIILKKHDRAGLLTFSDKIGSAIKADNGPGQLHRILEALYREEERPDEANFELLYTSVRQFVGRRSLLLLFTNFESHYAMMRALPELRRINRQQVLVVVFFENTEISDYLRKSPQTVEDIYVETTARHFVNEKQRIVHELRQYGIQSILTRPENLTLDTINKYLELKAKGAI